MILGFGAAVGGSWFLYQKYAADLPDGAALKDYHPSLVTRVYDANDLLIAEYFVENRILTPLAAIPENLIQATIAVEDAHFFEHHGLNVEGIVRAMFANLKAGRVVQGGSSITQQVAKQLFLSSERTFSRKIKEAFLSIELERRYTKEQILEVYLNHIYYGHGAYGVEAAAQTYFGKSVTQLTLPEMAMIAGLPKAPTNYSPYNDPERAMGRRAHCLNRMVAVGVVTDSQAEEAKITPFNLVGRKKPLNKAPWFTEHVRRSVEKKYGAEALYRGGLTIRTTVDLALQEAAQRAVRAGLDENDKRLGYRGPVGHVEEGETPNWETLNPSRDDLGASIDRYALGNRLTGLVTAVDTEGATITFADADGYIPLVEMQWAHPVDTDKNARWASNVKDATTVVRPGDLVEVAVLEEAPSPNPVAPPRPFYKLALDQTPIIQGALMAIDPRTGHVTAMVGGYDAEASEFNRATQAVRQPGSSFKPIIYTAALDNGFSPATVVIDAPIIYDKALTDFAGWKPMNFEQKFFGPTTIREAVTHSRNVVTIKVLEKIGVGTAIRYARKFGVATPLDKNLGLALGASPVRLVDMVTAYGTLANNGFRNEPLFVRSVEGPDGAVLEKNDPVGEQVIDPSTAFLMTNIMRGVVEEGTAAKIGHAFDRPIAGKTGTTNNYNDAWFIGYTPDLACGVWVGRDDNTPLGRSETGSRTAIPLWKRFMTEALEKRPAYDFVPTDRIVFARVDKKTGLPTRDVGENAIFEAFLDGTQPAPGDGVKKINPSGEAPR